MKIAFIGTGNMGGALARAASREKDNQLFLVNRHPEKAERLQKEIGGTVTDLAAPAGAAELLLLGVKPLMLPGLCGELRPLLQGREARAPKRAPSCTPCATRGAFCPWRSGS